METIVVAELEKYWITFEQLLQRWNIKDNLLASYCVCIDTSKGNCPLTPHFYQGEFLVPGGEVWKKLAIYDPRYKNTAEYINKNKTEYQLVQEFLDSITGIRRDAIWFPISSVEELEENDYSLAAAAQNYLKENSRSVTKERAAPVEEEEQISDSMPTREDVLAEVGKWHALEPANEAIHVGLMRLQDSSYRGIYSKVFGEEVTGEFTKAMREKIRRRWCSFLNLADDRGIPKKTLEDMVSPR